MHGHAQSARGILNELEHLSEHDVLIVVRERLVAALVVSDGAGSFCSHASSYDDIWRAIAIGTGYDTRGCSGGSTNKPNARESARVYAHVFMCWESR